MFSMLQLGFQRFSMQEKEKQWRWLAVRHFCRTRPSLRLSYSLPDLELVKDRAPEVGPCAGRFEAKWYSNLVESELP